MIKINNPEKVEVKRLRQLKSRTTISNLSELKYANELEPIRIKHTQSKSC